MYTQTSVSDKCWRNCGVVGNQTHIFWDFSHDMQALAGFERNFGKLAKM